MTGTTSVRGIKKPRSLTQEQIVLVLVLALVVVFGVFLDGFISTDNLLNVVRSVSVLGILSIAMAITVIARGLDLSLIASMGVGTAFTVQLIGHGMLTPIAIGIGLAVVIAIGLINGFLIAFVEVPALFATLASGLFVFGFARTFMLDGLIADLPSDAKFIHGLGQGRLLGIPWPVVVFVLVALATQFFLSRTKAGRFIYAHGDNTATARLTGIPTRPFTVLEYVLSAVIGFIGGLVSAGSVGGFNTQVISGSLLYDVLLVVVVGGISLMGGRGSVISVVVGAALISVMLNGMTILDMNTHQQNIVKGLILLGALVLDNRLHPRDEETVRQGD